MSGRLVSAVFDSALPAWLKPYAAAFASFANDDGSSVFPTIHRIALMTGRADRSVQRAAGELRRRHVLVPVAAAGRYKTTRYRLDSAALPGASDGVQLVFLLDYSRFLRPKGRKAS